MRFALVAVVAVTLTQGLAIHDPAEDATLANPHPYANADQYQNEAGQSLGESSKQQADTAATTGVSLGMLRNFLRGTQGPKGDRGPTGQKGEGMRGGRGGKGPTGLQGPIGIPGVAGPAGVTGPSGVSGPRGLRGYDGKHGPAGKDGDVGPKGPIGQSVVGPRGEDGPQGLAGQRGEAGMPGKAAHRGAAGPTGAVGPAGLAGEAGSQGETGLSGARGPRGLSGARGIDGVRGLSGRHGQRGVEGPAGPVGEAGPAGKAGSEGKGGPHGPEGPRGLLGERGPAGDTNCETTSASGNQVMCTGTGASKSCNTYKVPIKKVSCGSAETPVNWGINGKMAVHGEIHSSGEVHAQTLVIPHTKASTDLGEAEDMDADTFAKLVQGNSVDVGALALGLHQQARHHKNKIDRLERLVAKQTSILQNLATQFHQAQVKNESKEDEQEDAGNEDDNA